MVFKFIFCCTYMSGRRNLQVEENFSDANRHQQVRNWKEEQEKKIEIIRMVVVTTPFFPSLLIRFIFPYLIKKENMNTSELNIQESVISSMTPYKDTQILLFFLFPLLSLNVSYLNETTRNYTSTNISEWHQWHRWHW